MNVVMANNYVYLRGGSERVRYYVSGSALNQDGVVSTQGYQRLNGRINLTHKFGDQWSVDLNSYISRSDQDGSNQEDGGTGFFLAFDDGIEVFATILDRAIERTA